MFATIILDAYGPDDRDQIASALDMLCSPTDNYGWASNGVYSFFALENQQLMYLGLASDLAERFRQHNGLIPCEPNCCKKQNIDEYFTRYPRLGFGVLLMSPLEQIDVAKHRRLSAKAPADVEGNWHAQVAEGALIETYRQAMGVLPQWNRIGGSKHGQQLASSAMQHYISAMSGQTDFFLIAKSTLRELASSALLTSYEEKLHAARMLTLALYHPEDYQANVERVFSKAMNPLPAGYLARRVTL